MNEVSVLSPGVEPTFPRARVEWIGEPEDSAGDVIYGDGTLVRRFYANAVLAVGGRPLRTSAGHPLPRVGRDYVVDQPDGSQVIYSGADGYREALREGTLGVR